MSPNDGDRPCLTVIENEANEDGHWETVFVDLTDLRHKPDWDNLASSKTAQVVEVLGDERIDTEEKMMQLALAVKSLTSLEAIIFKGCRMIDLSHLFVATTDSRRLMAFRFIECKIELRAANILQFILKSNLLRELWVENCKFNSGAANAIHIGLSLNKSLVDFRWFSAPVQNVVGNIISTVPTLKKLHLAVTADGIDSFWSTFRLASTTAIGSQLECLSFYDTHIDHACVESIMMKCLLMPSLQELGFFACTFTKEALDLLMKVTSKFKLLDTLSLDDIRIQGVEVPVEFDCGNVQVLKLAVTWSFADASSMSTLDAIAKNPCIQSLSVSIEPGSEGLKNLSNAFLIPNCGPSELTITAMDDDFMQTLKDNTSIQSLNLHGLDDDDLVRFAKELSHMRGLRKLSVELCRKRGYLEEFFSALVQSLEDNTSLQALTLTGIEPKDSLATNYFSLLRYYLAINRIGRSSLMTRSVPIGLWAHVLAKTSKEALGIYYILREMPGIFSNPMSRKRKECDGRMNARENKLSR